MGGGQAGQVRAALVVHNHLLPGPLLQHLLRLLGGRQVGQAGLALLQTLTVKSGQFKDWESYILIRYHMVFKLILCKFKVDCFKYNILMIQNL